MIQSRTYFGFYSNFLSIANSNDYDLQKIIYATHLLVSIKKRMKIHSNECALISLHEKITKKLLFNEATAYSIDRQFFVFTIN